MGFNSGFKGLRADSHYTSYFHSVAERHRSVKFSRVYLNGYVHNDREVSVNSQFPSVAVAERQCLTGWNGSESVWTSSILIMWTVQRLVQYTSSVCLQRVLPGFSSEMDEKLIELVRKYEKIYDTSNEKYSDSAWKEKLWGQIGIKSWRNQVSSNCAYWSYYHSIITEVLLINK